MIEPGEIIGKYVVEAMVGEGGIARVYRVRHTTLGTVHALKLLAIRGGAVHRRLVREGRIQATLDHPHVVSVTDVIEHNGHPGLVMEYIEGLSLDRALQASGALSIDVTLALSAQLFGAIAAAHERSVLHRDLKPANVMLEPVSGGVRAMVTDFGIARLMADTGGDTLQGDFLGTPGYMAPEQVSDPTAIDVRADIYSLGALLYCMVCGRPPFLPSASLVETLQAASASQFPPVHTHRPECPEAVAATIEAALAADPNERPATVEAFAEQLFVGRPDLMDVVRGQPGVANIALQGAQWSERSQSAQPITSAPLTGRPAAGSHFTAVPETFDGGADTSDPSADRDALRGAEKPGIEEGNSAAIHVALSESTQDVIRAASRPARWPWVAAGAVALLGGILVLRPSTPPPAPPAATVSDPALSDAPPPTATPPSTTEGRAAPPEATATPAAPAPPPNNGTEPLPDRPAPSATPTGSGAPPTEAPRPAPTGTPPPASSSDPAPAEPNAGASGSAEAPPEAAEPPPAPGADNDTPMPTASEPAASSAPEPAATAEQVPEAPTPETTPPPPERPAIQGTWAGKYGGRPLNLRIQSQSGERIVGEMDMLAGPQNWKTVPLIGRLTPDGTVALSDAATGWSIEGRVTDDQLVGTIRHPNLRKPMTLRVGRR